MDALPTNADLVAMIEAFLARHAMAPTRFGTDATGDPNLLASLKAGASPRLDRLHRVATFMNRRDAELSDHERTDTFDPAVPSAGNVAHRSPEVSDA